MDDVWNWIVGTSSSPATKVAGLVGYALAGVMCLWASRTYRRARSSSEVGRGKHAWCVLSAIEFLLLADVRWNLRMIAANWGRAMATTQEYAQRGTVFPIVLLVLGTAAAIGLGAALWMMRRQGTAALVAACGAGIGLALSVVDGLSWHATDLILHHGVGPLMVIGWGWVVGCGLTVLGAVGSWIINRNGETKSTPNDE